MNCANCGSEEVKMVGSITSPTWECQRCGSRRPPIHEYDAPPDKDDPFDYEVLMQDQSFRTRGDKASYWCPLCAKTPTITYNGLCRDCFERGEQ